MPAISLIITVYKQLGPLELVFRGLEAQSYGDFEVILAEDDDAPATQELVRRRNAMGKFPVKHVFQEDIGFRKNRAMNAALRVADAESVVFLDADCIPHRHFLREYARRLNPNVALYGRRAMLSERFSAGLLRDGDPSRLTFMNLLLSGSRKVEDALYLPWLPARPHSRAGIWGCNWGIRRRHLMDVNGFDEDYVKWGIGEDADIEWRLHAIGVALQSVKHKAIAYHLYHRAHHEQATVSGNLELCRTKRQAGRAFCPNGLVKQGAL